MKTPDGQSYPLPHLGRLDSFQMKNIQTYFVVVFFNFPVLCSMANLNAAVLEKPLEKKAGRNYGPPGSRRLIYFIDDMNMPKVDAYGTVQPHTIIRQHMDYKHW